MNNYRVVAGIGSDLFFESTFVTRANAKFRAIYQHYRDRGNGLDGLGNIQLASCQYPKPDPLGRQTIDVDVDPVRRSISGELLRFVVVCTKADATACLSFVRPKLDLLIQIVIDNQVPSELWEAPLNSSSMATVTAPEIYLEDIFLSVMLDIGTANSDVFRPCIELFVDEIFGCLEDLYKEKVEFASTAALPGIPTLSRGVGYVPFIDRNKISDGYRVASIVYEIDRLTRWLEFLTVSYRKKYRNADDGFYTSYAKAFAVPGDNVTKSLRAALVEGGPAPRFILLPTSALTDEERALLLGEVARLQAQASKVKPHLHWNRWWALIPADRVSQARHAMTLCSNGRLRIVPTI